MSAVLTLKTTDGSTYSTGKLLTFRCRKERYTPYSQLTVTALCDEDITDVVEVAFSLDGKVLHKGIMDSLTVTKNSSGRVLRLTSRGFSSMLSQNELEPGALTQISLNTLMSEKMTVPGVTWQDSSDKARFIYIEDHDSQWSAIVSLCLTLNGDYPYIGPVNEVRLSVGTPLTVTPEKIFEEGVTGDYSRIVSHYHMKDVNGNYSYNYTDGYGTARGIVRHKYIGYDRQFVSLDDLGMQYRLNYTERGCRSRFLSYQGYGGEELRDKVKFPDGQTLEISLLEICGNAKKGIYTKDVCYFDRYSNQS